MVERIRLQQLLESNQCQRLWYTAKPRERVFVVSIRKDIDNGKFKMPTTIPLTKTLSDCLESGFVDRDVSLCIARRYAGFNGSQSYLRRRYFGKSFGQAVFEGNTSAKEQKEFFTKDPYKEFPCDGRIRQMTTRECFRLFGFNDSDHDKAASVSTSFHLYSQAGNSIVVNVVEEILKNLIPTQTRSEWLDELLGGAV
jgi:DNA (cytosine-5)-methyltransferase 1